MKILLGLFVLLCNTNHVWNQKTYSGGCTQFGDSDMWFFFQSLYMGYWYVQKTYDYIDTIGRDCITYTYATTKYNNGTIFEQSQKTETKTWMENHTFMIFDKCGKSQYEYVILDDNIPNWIIRVISTDYNTYSIEWSCFPNPNGETSDCFIWVLSRQRIVGKEYWDKVNPILKRHHISQEKLRIVKQDETLCIRADTEV